MLRVTRSTTFRWAVAIAAMFVASNLLLFAFIYWQTALYETGRVTTFLEHQAQVLAQASPEQLKWSIQERVYNDLHRVTFSAVFASNNEVLEGNLKEVPFGLPIDGVAHQIDLAKLSGRSEFPEPVIAVARRLPDGRLLVIGRNIQELDKLRETVVRALKLGVIPMAFLAVIVGAILSQRMNHRLRLAQQTLSHIREGQLHRRLPVGKGGDLFDLLAEGVNAMLEELERVVHELHNVGNNIAHDLRTPLARVRAQLDRAQRLLTNQNDLSEIIDRAIAGLDQTFAITTALLRIAEIETGRARASFGDVDISEILKDAADLYEPLAEAKRITISFNFQVAPRVKGDRDLLLEAFANLVDNAIKFTPEGGRIQLFLSNTVHGPVARICDTGPGIPPSHRASVFTRFYRCNQSRHVAGNGLGLSLVSAITNLHGFSIEIKDGSPGCIFELLCFSNERRICPKES